MQNILIISPISIAGELILKGFYEGFLKLGHKVDFVDVRELKNYESKNEPDFILCYDYGYLILQDAFLKVKKFLEKNKNLKLIHYFADDPFSNYALSSNDSLIQTFKNLLLDFSNNIELYFWDEKFLNSFSEKEGKFFPLCVNCDKYKDWDLEKKYDITFVGRPLGGNREEILAQVVKQFKNKLIVIDKKSINTYLNYVINKYGKDFVELYKDYVKPEKIKKVRPKNVKPKNIKIKKRKNKCIINNIIKQQQLIKNKIDKENKIKNQIEEIKNSNINFSKFGWVNKVSKILKITPQKVNCWMKKNMLEFYNNNCFKRKRRVREEVITRGT